MDDGETAIYFTAWMEGFQGEKEPIQSTRDVVAPLLAHLVAVARKAHAALAVDEREFARHIGRSVSASGGPNWLLALHNIHAADLLLAYACAQRLAGALERFDAQYRPVVAQVLRRLGVTKPLSDDVEQQVRMRLLGTTETGESRFLSYSGRGPLSSWVAVSVQRVAQTLRHREATTRIRQEAFAREGLPAVVAPELTLLKHKYRELFSRAFEQALAGLSDRERTLLRLHLLGCLRLDQIAPMFRVDASTISRWLAAARADILAQTRRFLAGFLPVSATELVSIARLLRSQIDVSLIRILQEEPDRR